MAGLGDLYKTLFGGEEPPPRLRYRQPPQPPDQRQAAPYWDTGLNDAETMVARRAELQKKYGDDFRHTGPLLPSGPLRRENAPVFEVPVSQRTHEGPGFRSMAERLSVYADPESTEGIPLVRFGASLLDSTNPSGQIHRWRTPVNVLGEYYPEAQTDAEEGTYEARMWKEMRLDPADAAGHIGLSPEVAYGDYGRAGGAVEHELMHKAIQELVPSLEQEDQDFIKGYEEPIVRRIIDQNLGLNSYQDAIMMGQAYPTSYSRLDGVISRLNTLANSTLTAQQKASGGVVIDDGNPAKRRKLI